MILQQSAPRISERELQKNAILILPDPSDEDTYTDEDTQYAHVLFTAGDENREPDRAVRSRAGAISAIAWIYRGLRKMCV